MDFCGFFNRKKIYKIFNIEKPNIVNINNIFGFVIDIFKLFKNFNIPIVFTIRDYYTICPNSKLITSEGTDCNNKNKISKLYKKINGYIFYNLDSIVCPFGAYATNF